jgi:WD40 repeat protein
MPQSIHLAAISPDGNVLAVVEDVSTDRIRLWDAQTGKKLGDLGEHVNGIN